MHSHIQEKTVPNYDNKQPLSHEPELVLFSSFGFYALYFLTYLCEMLQNLVSTTEPKNKTEKCTV